MGSDPDETTSLTGDVDGIDAIDEETERCSAECDIGEDGGCIGCPYGISTESRLIIR